jgi:hypothetical protein
MNIQTIAETGGQEWLVYSFTSLSSSIAGNINADWELWRFKDLRRLNLSLSIIFS